MKQLHKVSSSSAYKRDEEVGEIQYEPKSNKNKSLSRTLNYMLKEQRLLFIVVGILIGSTLFFFQPTLLSSSRTDTSSQRDSRTDTHAQRASSNRLTEARKYGTKNERQNSIQDRSRFDDKDLSIGDNKEDVEVVDNKDDVGTVDNKEDVEVVDNKDDGDVVENKDDGEVVDNKDDGEVVDNKDDGEVVDNKDDGEVVDNKDNVETGDNKDDVETGGNKDDVENVDNKDEGTVVDNKDEGTIVDNKDVPLVDYSKDGNGVSGRVPVEIRRKVLRIVVTGGSGFVGSHLVDQLMSRGHEVIVLDNFFTGRKENVVHHLGNPNFELIRHDVVEPILLEVDQIFHLACPASPIHYKYNPVKTIKTNVMGTLNMLGLAKRVGARFLLTSTSEVYGDPLQHPQKETYWGNVNPIGERSCYDEGKRVAETLSMDYHRGAGVEVRIARIFNTYGPRMCLDDGRVVSNFVSQAIRKQPMTIYGEGKQTRSFQYVSDLVNGFLHLMEGEHVGPFNLGNPGEFTMLELAEVVKQVIDPSATIEYKPNTADDPRMRKPDISKAKELLNWEPKISLKEGLPRMVSDFRNRILNEDEGKGNR